MKYVVFLMAAALSVPCMAFVAICSKRLRHWMLSALIFSTCLGDKFNITFCSIPASMNYRGPDRGIEITLTDLFAWALVIALVVRAPRKICWLPFNSVWMFLLFAVAVIPSWQALLPFWSVFSLTKFIRVYILYWCVVNCMHAGTGREYVLRALIAAVALVTLIVAKQKFQGGGYFTDGMYRTPGPFDHPLLLAIYLDILPPVLLVWGLCDKERTLLERAAALVSVIGVLFAILMTLSRASLALGAGSVLVALVLTNLRLKSQWVWIGSIILCICLLLGAGFGAGIILKRVETAPAESWQARKEYNAAALLMWKDNFFGIGLNNYSAVLLNEPKYRKPLVILAGEDSTSFCHNIYLLTLAETGIPGLALFLIIIVRFLWLTGSYAWKTPRIESILLSGFFVGFCALHLHGMLEFALRSTPVLQIFIISSGVCVALSNQIEQQRVLRASAVPDSEG